MKRRGPDSLEGLFIAFLCCLIFTLMSGTAGLSSMLYVACMARYGTDRNRAAFPFTLYNVLQAVSGPFAGYFAKRFSVRAVVCSGSIIAFLGIAACFLAEDITTVTALWGVIFGIGFGLSTLLLPAVINDYFFKQRSKALGMCYLGSPIGFFIFPPIFEVLLEKYGLSGTFLFMAAIIMHCIPLSLLLRQPSFKLEEEVSPLNEEKRGSYSSTDNAKPCVVKSGKSEKYSERNGVENTLFRRNSIEYLWNQTPSAENVVPYDKQYVLVLNKRYADNYFIESEALRSFRKNGKNHYENLHKQLEWKNPNNNFNYYEHGFLSENGRPKTSNYTISDFKKYPDFSKDAESIDNNNRKKSPLPLLSNQNYEEFSTIYFGTDQTFSTSVTQNQDLNCSIDTYQSNNMKKSSEGSIFNHNEPFSISNYTKNALRASLEVPILTKYKKIDANSSCSGDTRNEAKEKAILPPTAVATSSDSKKSLLFSMYLNPVFILICIINGVASLHFTTLTTVIIDFSRDLRVDNDFEKFIMMCIALMGAVGMLGFGWVTDGGYMARNRFASLTQFIGCIATAALPFATGFETLMIPLAIWCVGQSSFIPLIPAIIADHLSEDIRTVAISACNVLSGPLYLVIPPLIGYFRDEKGSYDNIFYFLGALSLANSLALFSIPYLARWRYKLA